MKIVLAGPFSEDVVMEFRKVLPQHDFLHVTNEAEFLAQTTAEIIILRVMKAPESIIRNNPCLKSIIRWGAGYDSVDIEAAGKLGVYVSNIPGANAYAVSELAVMLMLAVGRSLLEHNKNVHAGIWKSDMYSTKALTLHGKLVGLIGGGAIGRQTAEKVRAFGATVQYYDICRIPEEIEIKLQMTYVDLDTLLKTSDIISLHIPLTNETRHIIDEKQLEMMKPSAIIINTARGGLINDKALVKAIAEQRIRGAGLDCIEKEPLHQTDQMQLYDNIIVTPHIGGISSDLAQVMIPRIRDEVVRISNGEPPLHLVNEKYLKD